MNFISLGFWAAFCAFFLIYIFVKKWSRTAMLLWVLAFDLFFFWQANGWLMLLLPATAAVNYYLTEFMRKSGAAAEACRRAAGNYFPDKFAGKPISAPPVRRPPVTTDLYINSNFAAVRSGATEGVSGDSSPVITE